MDFYQSFLQLYTFLIFVHRLSIGLVHGDSEKFDVKLSQLGIDYDYVNASRLAIFLRSADSTENCLITEALMKQVAMDATTMLMIIKNWLAIFRLNGLKDVDIWCCKCSISQYLGRRLQSIGTQLFRVHGIPVNSTREKNRILIQTGEWVERFQITANVVFVESVKCKHGVIMNPCEMNRDIANIATIPIRPRMGKQLWNVMVRNFEPYTISHNRFRSGIEIILIETVAQRMNIRINYSRAIEVRPTVVIDQR